MAETYHVINMWELPAVTLATLFVGLRENSRIKTKMSGSVVPVDVALQISIVDKLNYLIWMQTEDARHGRNKPKSIMQSIINKEKNRVTSFATAADFEAERQRIINNG